MRRTTKPFLKASELFLILMFFAVGVMVPTAYGSILKPETPPIVQQPTSVGESKMACQMIEQMDGVEECHVMDFTAFDIIVPSARHIHSAKAFCEEAAKAIGSTFRTLSGKTYKVRISYSGEVLTTAACRVPAFLS